MASGMATHGLIINGCRKKEKLVNLKDADTDGAKNNYCEEENMKEKLEEEEEQSEVEVETLAMARQVIHAVFGCCSVV